MPPLAGFTYHAAGAGSPFTTGYFAVAERRQYDFHDPAATARGLVVATLDPLERRTEVSYDAPYATLPLAVRQVVNAGAPAPADALVTRAEQNYRLLQPKAIIDVNGNRTEMTYSPLGLPAQTGLKGKSDPMRPEGDLQRPSAAREYDFRAFVDRGQPISVRTRQRAHHDSEGDVPLPRRDEIVETRQYSDGFGRLLQSRMRDDDLRYGDGLFGGGSAVLPAAQDEGTGGPVRGVRNPDAARQNVVVTGWKVYDNKGRVVEQYEPFFSSGWDYAPPSAAVLDAARKAAMFYDARGRVIRTVNPDGSEQRAVYGVPGTFAAPISGIPTSSSRRPGRRIHTTPTTMRGEPTRSSRRATGITGTRLPASPSTRSVAPCPLSFVLGRRLLVRARCRRLSSCARRRPTIFAAIS